MAISHKIAIFKTNKRNLFFLKGVAIYVNDNQKNI